LISSKRRIPPYRFLTYESIKNNIGCNVVRNEFEREERNHLRLQKERLIKDVRYQDNREMTLGW